MKKMFAMALSLLMLLGLLAGCGQGGTQSSEASPAPTTENNQQMGGEEQAEPLENDDRPYAGTTLKIATSGGTGVSEEHQAVFDMLYDMLGIEIEHVIIPPSNDGDIDKLLVQLMAGDEIDFFYAATPNLKPYYNAGVLTPLTELAESLGYDMEGTFGSYLPRFGDDVYGLPCYTDIWLTLYNKEIFDAAGLEYPTAEGWTWEKYIETAEAIVENTSGEYYGSLMLDYDNYNYMYAFQKGAEAYKADGTSNFDDPRFAEGLEFFYSLGNDYKIQPSILEFKAGAVSWDAFAARDSIYGMQVCGGWTLGLMSQSDSYPRDWKVGVLPMPYPEGEQPTTLAVSGCHAIPSTSKNKEAAFAAIACIAENQWRLGYGRVPARVDLSEEEVNAYIEEQLITPYLDDGVTVEEIREAWFNSNRIALEEKVVGPGDAEINQIWVDEGQLYGQNGQTLEQAIENIISRSNNAIAASDEKL